MSEGKVPTHLTVIFVDNGPMHSFYMEMSPQRRRITIPLTKEQREKLYPRFTVSIWDKEKKMETPIYDEVDLCFLEYSDE